MNLVKNNLLTIPYIKINALFAGIIILIIIYSGIFSAKKDNYPIKCSYKEIYGINCPTCGISRSFTEILNGNFKNAKNFNANGIPVFIFFMVQLILRILTSIVIYMTHIKIKTLSYIDSFISILLFLSCFKNLIF